MITIKGQSQLMRTLRFWILTVLDFFPCIFSVTKHNITIEVPFVFVVREINTVHLRYRIIVLHFVYFMGWNCFLLACFYLLVINRCYCLWFQVNMGIYLSTPKTEKFSDDGDNGRLRYGLSSMQGWRATMEDAVSK